MEGTFNYSFPALRGIQAGKEYYVVMCPLRLIPKIFLFDEEEIAPEHRAQRTINRSRVPDICTYILENQDDYVFSSLTASIDGPMEFQPYSDSEDFKDIGRLFISLEARFLINDGQHRRAAIEEALRISPSLGRETLSVVFFKDVGLLKSQQIFADLNRHAVNTTTSLGILYEHRDQLATLTKEIVSSFSILDRYTDRERQSLSKLSPRIFSLNNIFNANLKIINKKRGEMISDLEKSFLFEYWKILSESITEWQQVRRKELSAMELRANFINAHGVFLEAIGIVGNHLLQYHPTDWQDYIKQLATIDWHRNNPEWMGRSISQTGRINKSALMIQLTANLIKLKLGLPLTKAELEVENKLKVGV